MDKSGPESTILLMNAFLMFIIGMTALFFCGLFTDFSPEEMRDIVIASVFLFSNLGFFALGIALLIMGRKGRTSIFNRLLPWICIVGFSLASIKESYQWLVGPLEDRDVAWAGLLVAVVTLALTGYEMNKLMKKAKSAQGVPSGEEVS